MPRKLTLSTSTIKVLTQEELMKANGGLGSTMPTIISCTNKASNCICANA